mmetsp:Transcript_31250/g.72526  ORF Transcript_31250/g.72526 Transcript_31250/m.72526 type:complete len:226 (+) Transcript_31250:91-768(+)
MAVAAEQLKLSLTAAQDDFFEHEPGLVAAFDYDYDEMMDFYTKLAWARFVFFPPAWLGVICCVPCFINKNVGWDTRTRHVALTIDGIKFVHDKRKFLWGLYCCDKGKESKTVPYDKITDCDVQEPAGTACCCCVERVLYTVSVDTASSGAQKEGGPTHELVLEGLACPHEFKQAVWGLKRGDAPGGSAGTATKPKQVDMNTQLLTEIRDEMRKLNTLMAAKYGAA